MTIQKCVLSVSRFLQAATLPLMLSLSNFNWHDWPFLALLGLTLVLAALSTTSRTTPWTIAALALAIIGSSSQWALLPLALAQVGLGWLLATQKMSAKMAITGWLVELTFIQIMLSANLTQGLTTLAPIVFALINGLLLLCVWAGNLPLWLLAVLGLAGLGMGYWMQQFTLSFCAAFLVVASVLNTRRIKPNPLPFSWAGIILNLTFIFIRIHG
ncbi:hypothetical protein [Lacticaseibacillus camelliae]|uniref:Uncharacterized protein n=1 Tax=Lacticaseibacillus camelliae DSM 22697 = JCM 13995 TaxID=1423730 RepID=A0A0R2F6Q5_9LACO|nr:hypothetical protein [Lacticaseibacillus camelliae]KRN20780.1 hypothetical protein FC75_GL000113 [Lacticaseibacillus camelliae DSM 22697 = JCM 13995]